MIPTCSLLPDGSSNTYSGKFTHTDKNLSEVFTRYMISMDVIITTIASEDREIMAANM